ncbi:MAG: hypothetical protein M3R00_08325, partial [Pseudomonadota bacterium]|nr:hypothetical protein [Pseudomonadota bacterium]
SNALSSLESASSDIMIYGGLAFGLGWLIANGRIPYLSESVLAEQGSVKAITLTVTGAKFGFLLTEFLKVNPTELNLNTLTEKLAELQRLAFILQLQQHKELLPHLPYRSKRLLIELMRREDRHQPFTAETMSQLVFPERERSIFAVTISLIFGYIPMTLRCLATIVTWDKEPWRQLFEKTSKDLTRIVHAISHKILGTAAHFVRILFRGICDVVANEIFARAEGLLRNNAHTLSRGTYKITAWVDSTYERAKEFFAQPVDALRKAVTRPNATGFLVRLINKFRPSPFASSKPDTGTENIHFNRKQLWKPRAFQDAELKRYPDMLRTIFNDSKKREKFFREDWLFHDNENQSRYRNKRYKTRPKNCLHDYLASNNLNYELIRDIIHANRNIESFSNYFASHELVNLMCLDRSGNIAVDLLTKQFGSNVSFKVFSDPNSVVYLLQQFYDNPDVLRHLHVDLQHHRFFNTKSGLRNGFSKVVFGYIPGNSVNTFVIAVKSAFEQLFYSNITAALNMLMALMDNHSTQAAMALFFANPSVMPKLLQTNDLDRATTNKLVAAIRQLSRTKENWQTVASAFDHRFDPVPETKPRNLPEPVKKLFSYKENDQYSFFPKQRLPDYIPDVGLADKEVEIESLLSQ